MEYNKEFIDSIIMQFDIDYSLVTCKENFWGYKQYNNKHYDFFFSFIEENEQFIFNYRYSSDYKEINRIMAEEDTKEYIIKIIYSILHNKEKIVVPKKYFVYVVPYWIRSLNREIRILRLIEEANAEAEFKNRMNK